jgi:NTP pyrophosphatase (non-canonical NTP hydrolase)
LRKEINLKGENDAASGKTGYENGKNSSAHNGFYLKEYVLNSFLKHLIMTIQEAQQKVDAWINTTGVRYFSELTNTAILTEEVGEVARLMSRLYGDQSFKESDKEKNLSDELADVLWVLICIANQTGIDLTEALQKNFEKKNLRDADRHQQNEKLKP